MRDKDENGSTLLTGQFLGLKFASGWLFTRILETEFIELKPWILLNESENRAEIAPATAGSEDDEVVDALDRHFLVPEENEQNLIFQVKYGIDPSRMDIYTIFGRDRSPNLVGTAEPGSPQVPVNGFDSPYNDPSEQTELFVLNSQEFPSFQAYNPMDEAEEARLSFHVNKMKYAVVTDMNIMKAMLQGQQPAKLHPMGLGAQRRDQLSVPAWVNRNFGEHIHTTEEILTHESQRQSANQPAGGSLPLAQESGRIANGGGNNGGGN